MSKTVFQVRIWRQNSGGSIGIARAEDSEEVITLPPKSGAHEALSMAINYIERKYSTQIISVVLVPLEKVEEKTSVTEKYLVVTGPIDPFPVL